MESTKSENIGKLIEALSKAQSLIEGAPKDCANPYFKSKYADLSSTWNACRGPLTANGLAIVQTVETIDNRLSLCTLLAHSSGEWIKSVLPVPVVKMDAQSLGSALTYCRRFALGAIVGICPIDDDGEAAMVQSRMNKVQAMPSPDVKDSFNGNAVAVLEETLNIEGIDVSELVHFLEIRSTKANKSVEAIAKAALVNKEILSSFKRVYSEWLHANQDAV